MKKNNLLNVSLLLLLLLAVFPLHVDAKKLKVAQPADVETLDPYMQLSGTVLAVANLIYDPLVRMGSKGELIPMLATEWKQVNPKTIQLTLRKNIKFQSGNPFSADDVIWTAKRMSSAPDYRALFNMMTFKKIDSHTIEITTKDPYPLTMNLMSYVFPMDKKFFTGKDSKGKDKGQVVKLGDSFANSNTSGTGPFILVKRDYGKILSLKAKDDYWGKRGNVTEIDLIPIKEDATRVAALLRGDVDIISPVAIQDYAQIERNPNATLHTISTLRAIVLTLNSSKGKALSNKKIREAVVLGTNTKGIVSRILNNKTTALYALAPENLDGYDASLSDRYNVEKAKAALKEAGYDEKNRLKLTMISPNNRYVKDEDTAKAFTNMMARINIDVALRTMPKAQYWTAYDEGTADIALIGWAPDTRDSVNYGEYLLMTQDKTTGYGAYNAGHYSNPKYDNLLKQANYELDKSKRTKLIQEANRIIYEDFAILPIMLEPISWGVRKNVIGFEKIINIENFLQYGELTVQ